ncbi:MAG: Thiamine-monophosphate kinase [Phycisphaerae bacterium]|nr:Thiamine-monophosphate kinase [Phycisphaerae bacterium]
MATESKGEFELLRRLLPTLGRRADLLIPPGDDMAELSWTAPSLLVATDMLMDGVDFRPGEHTWAQIGRKAMDVNLSDCAAMAVVPVAALCSLALNDELSMDAALQLADAIRARGETFNCPLIGGDTNSWASPTVINVTVLARSDGSEPPIRRDGARPGDRIFLSGPVGGSILGRHIDVQPRVALALDVNRSLHPHAMIDISDGLAIDLYRILDASRCGAVLNDAALAAAIHPDARRLANTDGTTARDHALYDGEDFELIIVCPASVGADATARLGLIEIGVTCAQRGCWIDAGGGRREVERRGWEHFQ